MPTRLACRSHDWTPATEWETSQGWLTVYACRACGREHLVYHDHANPARETRPETERAAPLTAR